MFRKESSQILFLVLLLTSSCCSPVGESGSDADVDEAGLDGGVDGDRDPSTDADTDPDIEGDASRDADSRRDAEVDGNGPIDGGSDAEVDMSPEDILRFDELHFAATHNSYSGGEVGSIPSQLDGGVRVIELDVHDNDFVSRGYRVGHDGPGDEVAAGEGNPTSDALRDWLETVSLWSREHPDHAPITVYLDLKDDLTDNRSNALGNLANLNQLLLDVFGATLHTADSLEDRPWRPLIELRGRIITVLSGHEGSRLAYSRDSGAHPAVAMNDSGRIIEVHDSGDDDLWFWTGEMAPDGAVVWHRHGWYDTGIEPAVALNDEGLLVEVHEDPDSRDDQLWYRVGRLTLEFEIEWFHEGGLPFPGGDEGVDPSIRFTDRGGRELRELHRSARTGDHWYWNGTIDLGGGTVIWERDSADGGRTDEPLHDRSRDEGAGHVVEVDTGSHGPFGEDTLICRVDDGASRRIRFRQIAFVEHQYGGSRLLEAEGLRFFAGAARDEGARSRAEGWRRDGRVVRLWQFNRLDFATDPPVNFPATDFPRSDWYLGYCEAIGCVE